MSKQLQAVRGMNDILPQESHVWLGVEEKIINILNQYGYQNIRTPIIESTALFARSIGDETDIVEKEMYSFTDRNKESLTLRPEGTAGCVRAGIQHGLFYNQVQRLWTMGPMFRYERPQKGRYRQFHQISIEAYGMNSEAIDAEIIMMNLAIWKSLNIDQSIHLELNCIGNSKTRNNYKKDLITYLTPHLNLLDENSKNRLHSNTLRILDSKDKNTQKLLEGAPVLQDYLDEESLKRFEALLSILKQNKINYVLNSNLVRGLDYYNDMVFEWTTDALGAQNAVAAGGRYDNLVSSLGGKSTPAVGFAIGIERLILLVNALESNAIESQKIDVAVIILSGQATGYALSVAQKLRLEKNLCVSVNCTGGSFKSQMKAASKLNAKAVAIIGEDEFNTQTVTIKFQTKTNSQLNYSINELSNFLLD